MASIYLGATSDFRTCPKIACQGHCRLCTYIDMDYIAIIHLLAMCVYLFHFVSVYLDMYYCVVFFVQFPFFLVP